MEMEKRSPIPTLGLHGAAVLPSVSIDCYNVELRDAKGFVGDRANKAAFRAIVKKWRKLLRNAAADPLGKTPSAKLSIRDLDELLLAGEPACAGVVHAAIEEFAQELAGVIRRFLKLEEWRGTERIVIGGGLSESRVGELAIGRAAVVLGAEGEDVTLRPVRNPPDEAGLIGAAHLYPSWTFEGHDAVLAIDIGGTNIRAGVVLLNLKKADDLSKAAVWRFELWRHAGAEVKRLDAVDRLVRMLDKLILRAGKEGVRLAPFIGVGCPGLISADGSIERGAQNLPGDWASSRFNLPACLHDRIPQIAGHETTVVLHNDGVVQGLSEAPFMRDVGRWGALTIGTGLGNARFTNRRIAKKGRGRR
jgi:predicted NBD/HSP70 family sugar kinase